MSTVRNRIERVVTLHAVFCASFLLAGWTSLSDAQASVTAANPSKTILQNVKPAISLKSMSLLDPERFSMHQQYMMSFSSTSGNGGLMGMYINSMEYRFNAPLIMRLKVAYQTQTGMLFGRKDSFTGLPQSNQGRLFVPSFDLVYKPWKNTTIGIYYRDYSGMYANNPYQRYGAYNSWGYDMDMYNMLYGWDRFDSASHRR